MSCLSSLGRWARRLDEQPAYQTPPGSNARGVFSWAPVAVGWGAGRSGRRFLLHYQSIQCRADFGKAAGDHGAARVARISADANAACRCDLLCSRAQRDDRSTGAVVLLARRGRTPWCDGASFDGTRCWRIGWARSVRRGISSSAMGGSVANEECTGQVMNHDELRLTAGEVRQDSTGATRRDRITGRVMPMPATRLVARESVQQLVADQANGQTFQLEVILIG